MQEWQDNLGSLELRGVFGMFGTNCDGMRKEHVCHCVLTGITFFCGRPRSSPENLLLPSLPASRLSSSYLEPPKLRAANADDDAGCRPCTVTWAIRYVVGKTASAERNGEDV